MKTNEARKVLAALDLPPTVSVMSASPGSEYRIVKEIDGALHPLAEPMPLGDAVRWLQGWMAGQGVERG